MPDAEERNLPFGAANPVFATTHWSVVLQAGETHSSQATAALEELCRTYWFPLYAFIRRKGRTEEDAKDLTQQFFARLLERRDFQRVEARKGKFRTFLLAALSHFLSNERDYMQAAKRGGGKPVISLDEMTPDQLRRFEPASTLSPDKLFDQRWAMTMLEKAVAKLREEAAAAGKTGQFDELKGFLTCEPGAGDYAAVAERLGSTTSSVAVTVHRMRLRYRELVRAEAAQTVSSPLEVDEEMRHLYAALNA